jgi:hypothetical protein
MQNGLRIHSTLGQTPHPTLQATNHGVMDGISVAVALSLPFIVAGAMMGHRKHKARLMQRRIQRLNRLWQLSSNPLS